MARGIKKDKVPGDVITMKTRLDEHPLVMAWINKQSNQGDSIRYLIEQDIIRRGGVCNLQFLIPTVRNLDELMAQSEVSNIDPPMPGYRYPELGQTVEEKKTDSIESEPPAQFQKSKAANLEKVDNDLKPPGKIDEVDKDKDSIDITEEDIGSWA